MNCKDVFPQPSVRDLVHRLEEVMIRSLHSAYGLHAHRLSRNEVGVWISDTHSADESAHTPAASARSSATSPCSSTSPCVAYGRNKVGAIGLHLSEWISTHGFALNVHPDLSAYDRIVSCGITDADKGVSSVQRELALHGRAEDVPALAEVSVRGILPHVVRSFESVFDVQVHYEEE
jgi:lipoate-protein ligase B